MYILCIHIHIYIYIYVLIKLKQRNKLFANTMIIPLKMVKEIVPKGARYVWQHAAARTSRENKA